MLGPDAQTLGGTPALISAETGEGPGLLADCLRIQRATLRDWLHAHGALLLRGFGIADAAQFEAVCEAGTPGLIPYTGGGSPRTLVAGKVYTSTDYAADQPIPLHCEYTYFPEPPAAIWFYCEQAAANGGETPIGDMAHVLSALDPDLVRRFENKGLRYIYNLHDGRGFGRGWRQAFGTDDREQVGRWLAVNRADYHWEEDGTLHAELIAPAVRVHPVTGVRVWGNQAVNWHISTHGEAMAQRLRRLYREERRLPKHATFGDAEPIPDADIARILEVLSAQERVFRWQAGDVLVCDNQRIAHGRRPFSGERRVLVALAA